MSDNRAGNSAQRSIGFGPWATTLDSDPSARLSTFWQRRMAMLGTLKGSSSRVSWTLRAALAAGAVAVLALPIVYLSGAGGLQADDSAWAAEKAPTVEFLPPPLESEKRILAALQEPTEIEFVETPLRDIVSYLQTRHKIPIQLDERALIEAQIDPEQVVTCKVKDIRLESALRLLLRPLLATHLIQDEVLLITTKDVADHALYIRTYPVGDLAGDNDYELLKKTITTAVRPDAWEVPAGGPGTISPVPKSRSLVISQSREVHDEILELLRALRAARDASGGSAPAGK